MRILMISDVYFPRINGVSTAIMTLRRELTRQGHQITLIAPDYGVPTGGAGTEDEANIYRIRSRQVWGDPEDRMMVKSAVMGLLPDLLPEQFDMVHVHTPFVAHYAGLQLARALGIPAVETYHTFFEEYLFHYVPLVPRPVMRYLARAFSRGQCAAVDGLIVPSRPMLEALQGYGITTHAEIIPTGIEMDDFAGGDGARFRARHGIPEKQPILLFVGRVAHEKNIGFLLESLVHVRQTHSDALLVIAGEGPASGALQQRAAQLGLGSGTRFIGYLDRQGELLDCYRAADLFVFSSRTETQGLVLLEAMALGVPVVGLAIMGTADVLRHGHGAHIAEDDARQFATRVSHLLTHRTERDQLARAALEYVQEWTAPEMTARLARFYEQTIARRATRDMALNQTDSLATEAVRAARRS
jgi:glycosyltransferase involved in cell wall biosynthesis